MKKYIVKSISLLLCVLLLAACSSNKVDSAAYLGVIPSDAMVVSKIEIGNLIEKSDLQNNTFVKVEFEKAIAELPAKQKGMLKEFFANPMACGIDVDAPVYAAVVNVEPVKVVVTAKMNDVSVFEDALFAFAEDNLETVAKDGMTYVETDEESVALAYDDNMIVIVVDEYYADVQSCLKLAPNKMAVNDEVFAPLFANDDDVSCIVNYEPLVQYMIRERMIEKEMIPLVAMMKGNVVLCSLDFEDGYMEMKSTPNLPEEYYALLKDFMKKSTRRHYSYIPGNSFAVMGYNFNFSQLYSFVETADLQKELMKYGINEEVAKGFLAALSGDYTAAAWINGETMEDAQFMAAVDCSDRSLFDLLVAYVVFEMDATLVEEDVYALNVNAKKEYNYYTYEYETVKEGYDYYLIYKDNTIMLTPENIYNKIKSRSGLRALRSNVKSNRLIASASNDIVVDFKALRDVIVQCLRDNVRSSSDEAILFDMVNTIDNITIDTGIDEYTLRVNTANPNINSLKYVLDKFISSAVRNKRHSY